MPFHSDRHESRERLGEAVRTLLSDPSEEIWHRPEDEPGGIIPSYDRQKKPEEKEPGTPSTPQRISLQPPQWTSGSSRPRRQGRGRE